MDTLCSPGCPWTWSEDRLALNSQTPAFLYLPVLVRGLKGVPAPLENLGSWLPCSVDRDSSAVHTLMESTFRFWLVNIVVFGVVVSAITL